MSVPSAQSWLYHSLWLLVAIAGFLLGAISGIGILLVGIAYIYYSRLASLSPAPLMHGLFIATVVAFHLLPWINDYTIFSDLSAGPLSRSYELRLSFENLLLLLILYFHHHLLIQNQPSNNQQRSLDERLRYASNTSLTKSRLALWSTAIICMVAPLPLADAFGLIDRELAFPWWLPWWAAINLFITCTTEEWLFRGYIQRHLNQRMPQIYALLFTSILFGLAHSGGGIAYVLVASIAGIGYGLIYSLSNRLIYAILAHFALNLCHLLLFTYPGIAAR